MYILKIKLFFFPLEFLISDSVFFRFRIFIDYFFSSRIFYLNFSFQSAFDFEIDSVSHKFDPRSIPVFLNLKVSIFIFCIKIFSKTQPCL